MDEAAATQVVRENRKHDSFGTLLRALRSLQAHKYSDLPAAPPCLETEHYEGVTQRIHTGTNLLKNNIVLRMPRTITVTDAFPQLCQKPSASTSASHQLTSSRTKNIMHQISPDSPTYPFLGGVTAPYYQERGRRHVVVNLLHVSFSQLFVVFKN